MPTLERAITRLHAPGGIPLLEATTRATPPLEQPSDVVPRS